jgi:uncharacterized membrane protein
MKPQLSQTAWIAIAGLTLLMVILVIAIPNLLWIVLSVPLVLFLPGFALTVILFSRKSLGLPERILLSVGLSVAFTALSGLLLNLTPWGLQAKTLWIALLLSLAVEIAVILLFRRNWWRKAITLPANLNFNTRQWVLMALAALMAIMAIRVARTPAPQQGLEGYTLLSVEAANTPNAVHVGVESEEFQPIYYQIRYQFNDNLQEGPTFRLQPGESWEKTVPLPKSLRAGTSFTVLLYRLDNPNEAYRRVVWWPNSQ